MNTGRTTPNSQGIRLGNFISIRVVHVPDVSEDPEYTLPAATTIGYRSVLAVPMMHQGVARESILVARDVVAPFSDKDIAPIQTFAGAAASRSPTTTRWSTASGRWASPCESTEQIEEWLMLLDV